ncbi:hypothetical protein CC78DRAFT_588142 [Lojkania enalia]|uniref:Uncharacterized protein n=1 Tax=Lojkania enalia TaxID=147567 RepID=A0A9P4JXM3_9PLEO|nr:hypothetical protein CC78DRAFT_588142 [Didymosphaeria enalia]
MHILNFSLALLFPLVLSRPSIKVLPRQELGPCDPWAEQCQSVRQANTCFAAFLPFNGTNFYRPGGNRTEMLRCVNDTDEAAALADSCACYGCDTEFAKWVISSKLCE